MKYNFDEVIDRRNTYSAKWDWSPMIGMLSGRYDEDTICAFTADMDFRCADSIKQEMQKVVDFNLYGYVNPDACAESYYNAVIGWFKRRLDWEIKKEQIVYVNGTVLALNHAVRAFTQPGDGVLINRPVYGPFTMAIEGNGRRVVNSQLVNNDGYYTVDFEDFERKAALDTTKLFMLCNPHNPSGRCWSEDELYKMAQICRKHGVIIAADEIHGDLVRVGQKFSTMAFQAEKAGADYLICTAVNKTFNLAGLGITNVVIPDERLRKAFRAQVGHSNPSQFDIAAVIGAYNGGEEWLEQLREYLDGTIDWVLDFLKEKMPKVKCSRPEGTYIMWMDFRGYGISPEEIHRRIYEQANVILEGGTMFDPDSGAGFERICIPTRRALIQEAFQRIYEQFKDLE